MNLWKRSTGRLALLAIAGLAVGAMAIAPLSAVADGGAVSAKKCKKAKKGAAAAKKKGCKKKKKKPVAPATPPPAPTTRATLTWTTNADLDLLVWDTSGNKARAGVSNPIAQSTISGDDSNGFGPESFVDDASPSNRQFSYGICAQTVSSSTNWTLTITNSSGLVETKTQSSPSLAPFTAAGQNVRFVYGSPASFDPGAGGTNGWCP